MNILKACAYIGALAASLWFYVQSNQFMKKMEALDQVAYASAPLVPGASQPSEPQPVQAEPAPVVAQPEPPQAEPAPVEPVPELLPGAGASVYLGGAPSCADLSAAKAWYDDPKKDGTGKTHEGLRYAVSRSNGSAIVPCTQARSFGNKFVSVSFGKLLPGTYELPYGSVTVLSAKRQ